MAAPATAAAATIPQRVRRLPDETDTSGLMPAKAENGDCGMCWYTTLLEVSTCESLIGAMPSPQDGNDDDGGAGPSGAGGAGDDAFAGSDEVHCNAALSRAFYHKAE